MPSCRQVISKSSILTLSSHSSLLVAQDREEIYLVIAEWDDSYEYYAIEGKLPPEPLGSRPSPSTSAPRPPAKSTATSSAARPSASSSRDTKKKRQQPPAQANPRPDSDRSGRGAGSGGQKVRHDGFLTMNVYGPFLTRNLNQMSNLTGHLLALSMHLAGVPSDSVGRLSDLALREPVPGSSPEQSDRSLGSSVFLPGSPSGRSTRSQDSSPSRSPGRDLPIRGPKPDWLRRGPK